MKHVALTLLMSATPLAAQDLPALHDVAGVASDDILNVRTRPMASSAVVGTLAYDARGIEVIEEENGWGRLNVDGMSGWANLKFLQQVPGSQITTAGRFKCFGTEPFWSMEVTPGQVAILSTPQGPDKAFNIGPLTVAQARIEPFALLGSAQAENVTLVVSEEICSDGMSDNLFGFDGTVVIGGYAVQVLSGCCSLQVN